MTEDEHVERDPSPRTPTSAPTGSDPRASDHPASDPAFVAGLRPIPSRPAGSPALWPATDIFGIRPDGTPIEVRIGDSDRPILVVFLATHCDGCDEYWRGLADERPDGTAGDPALDAESRTAGAALARVMPVIVTRGPASQEPADVAATAAGVRCTPVVMSDQAWRDYRVTSYPFFVLVDPASRRIIGETVGFGWTDVVGMIDARDHPV